MRLNYHFTCILIITENDTHQARCPCHAYNNLQKNSWWTVRKNGRWKTWRRQVEELEREIGLWKEQMPLIEQDGEME